MSRALTQGTAEWLLPKIGLISELNNSLRALTQVPSPLDHADFVEGPFYISLDRDKDILAIWHSDYLLGTDDEAWGFVKLSGPLSVASAPSISREVLERTMYVIHQRLRGLLIDAAYYHRKYDNGARTLLAGRGTSARHYSIAYFERAANDPSMDSRAIVCVGPDTSWANLSSAAEDAGQILPALSLAANQLLARRRPQRHLSPTELPSLRKILAGFFVPASSSNDFANVQLVTSANNVSEEEVRKTIGFTYDDWVRAASPLNATQRRILNSNVLDTHPLRLLGPAGSGKTLLMQLLALNLFRRAQKSSEPVRIIYIVHSEAMRDTVSIRFELLNGGRSVAGAATRQHSILVKTLAEYCREELQLEIESVLERDAEDAKAFQILNVMDAIEELREKALESNSLLLKQIYASDDLLRVFCWLTLSEISIAIKGHGLEYDRRRYVESERNLSKFHGILNTEEREFVFSIFKIYHRMVFEENSVLDPDDIALSLVGRLRTPVWQLRRREEGFDYVFVDEAQLFNETTYP